MKALFSQLKPRHLTCRLEPDSTEMSALPFLPLVLGPVEPLSLERAPFELGRLKPPVGILQIPDKIPYQISRRHCNLLLQKKGLLISDTSRLGTVVDGITIGATKGSADSITVGKGEHSIILGLQSSVFRFKVVVA